MGEEQKRWQTVWQNLQTYKSPLGTGPGDHDLFLVWNPPFRYQKYVITIFVWQFLTNLKLERMVKWWKYTCEGKYIFSVICCWKVLKCILDSIFDTNRSFRRPLIFGKENRLNPWHNAVFILIKEAESCILFMKLLNYIQKYLHWSWVYCPWKIFKRWHIFKVFELLFSVWAEQTVVVYPASEPSKLPFFYNSPPISTENNHYSVEPETDHDADAGANFIAKLRVTGKQCRFKR